MIAVVTGGSSGMGRATAKQFVAEGATVDRHGSASGQARRSRRRDRRGHRGLRERHRRPRLTSNGCGITSLAVHGRIDVIFANAGGGTLGAFGTISEADFDRSVTTNLKGTFFTVQTLLPLVVDGGSIILNGSIAASLGMPAFTVYSATKAAIRSFARTWTTDLSARRIRVNTLAPGTILTPILSEQAGLSDEQVEGIPGEVRRGDAAGSKRGSERDPHPSRPSSRRPRAASSPASNFRSTEVTPRFEDGRVPRSPLGSRSADAGGREGLSDQFQALRLFVQVARAGSFSKGARAMKLSQPTASRIIALLEEQLGATLFTRSTRSISLTEAGATYLDRVQPILALLAEADDAVRITDDLRGTLRVALSSIIASRAVVPRLGDFIARHPNLRVELTIDDRRQDLIQEGIDVAVRFGKLVDSSAVARLIGRWPLVVAAAPAYLEARGMPETPEALQDHAFVIAGPVAGKELTFRRGDQQVTVQPKGQIAIDGAEGRGERRACRSRDRRSQPSELR